jgi:hypothetical protein
VKLKSPGIVQGFFMPDFLMYNRANMRSDRSRWDGAHEDQKAGK